MARKKNMTLSGAEHRVMENSQRFEPLPEIVKHAQASLDMLSDKWEDIVALDEYMDSGQWLQDYEADERGEIGKDLPRGVLSQDALYDTLQELREVLRGMKTLARKSRELDKG